MKVELDLFASFMQYKPGDCVEKPCVLEIEDGTTVKQLMDRLDIPSFIPKIIFVNGIVTREGTVLKDGDRAGIFPQVAGG